MKMNTAAQRSAVDQQPAGSSIIVLRAGKSNPRGHFLGGCFTAGGPLGLVLPATPSPPDPRPPTPTPNGAGVASSQKASKMEERKSCTEREKKS